MARSAMFDERRRVPCARCRNRDGPNKDVWPKPSAFRLNQVATGEAIEWLPRPGSNAHWYGRARAHRADHARVRAGNMREQKRDRAEALVRASESLRKVRYRK